jgi:hypothetical protein
MQPVHVDAARVSRCDISIVSDHRVCVGSCRLAVGSCHCSVVAGCVLPVSVSMGVGVISSVTSPLYLYPYFPIPYTFTGSCRLSVVGWQLAVVIVQLLPVACYRLV